MKNPNSIFHNFIMIVFLLSAFIFNGKASLLPSDNIPDNQDVIQDTISQELEEIVVTSENIKIEGNKIIITPTKSERNLATDASGLIDNMSLPFLKVRNGEITSTLGGNVSIFINGVLADDMDLSTFWPQNAIKVEFMESSSDPTFFGKKNILNFIMKTYKTGGLTKINAKQTIPNSGKYDVSSKLENDNLTINAFASAFYNNNQTSTKSTQTIKHTTFNGIQYNDLLKEENLWNTAKQNTIVTAVNTRIRTNKAILTHSLEYRWNSNPGSSTNGSVTFNPTLFSGDKYYRIIHERASSPKISGNYALTISTKWSLYTAWSYLYSRNNMQSKTQEGDVGYYYNKSKEDIHNMRFVINSNFRPNDFWSIQLGAIEERSLFKTVYRGDSDSKQKQWRGTTQLVADLFYARPKIFINVTPILTVYDWRVNTLKRETEIIPGAQLNVNIPLNNRSRFTMNMNYHTQAPSASQSADLTLQQDDLFYIQGNTSLKSRQYLTTSASCNWFANRILDMSFNAGWQYISNEIYRKALNAPSSGANGIIYKYENANVKNNLYFLYTIGLNLFKSKLRINADIDFSHTIQNNSVHNHLSHFRPRASITYFLGNCKLSVLYYGKEKYIENGGTELISNNGDYNLNFTYGLKRLYLNVTLANIFNKHLKEKIQIKNGPLTGEKKLLKTGRYISVTISYTFDYGKKIAPNFDLNPSDQIESSILK